MHFLTVTTLDRRGRRSLQVWYNFIVPSSILLGTHTSKLPKGILLRVISNPTPTPQEVFLVLFFQEKNIKNSYSYIFPQTLQKLFRTAVLRFIPLKFRQKSIFFSVFPDVYQSYQHTFPQVVENSTVGLNKYSAEFVKINTLLNIEVLGKFCVLFDEITARLDRVSHQKREHRVARHGVLDGDL